jgi:hypothetical protein
VTRDGRYASSTYQKNRKLVLAASDRCQVRLPGCTGIATTADHVLPPFRVKTRSDAALPPYDTRVAFADQDGVGYLDAVTEVDNYARTEYDPAIDPRDI